MNRLIHKIITVFLAVTIIIMTCGRIPASAINVIVFKYNNYVVEYNIINEWDNNQNIKITMTNTGDETIHNWALRFDAGGEISGLWNGSIYNNKGFTMHVKGG